MCLRKLTFLTSSNNSVAYVRVSDLLLQADFLRPYELLERVLTHYAGRKLLLGRLGQEAEDGLNALLGQAMAYERSEVPSLTGLSRHW